MAWGDRRVVMRGDTYSCPAQVSTASSHYLSYSSPILSERFLLTSLLFLSLKKSMEYSWAEWSVWRTGLKVFSYSNWVILDFLDCSISWYDSKANLVPIADQ